MRVSPRKLRKWRKEKPMKHRSYSEKRGRNERRLWEYEDNKES